MKKVLKKAEPTKLAAFRTTQPDAGWEALRNDPSGGQTAYKDICQQTITDQGGLCAYCEVRIQSNIPNQCRVEHFYPKSAAAPPNWALEWNNMLAVCAGGSYKHAKAPYTLEPLEQNLSCDAHKNKMIQKGGLVENCEGWVLNPIHLPALPSLFSLNKSDGCLSPNTTACANLDLRPNHHANTEKLVEHTIKMLNLNCYRLCQARLVVIRNIEHSKKNFRKKNVPADQALPQVAQRYFRIPWPQFFTTICLCLGSAAEAHLESIQYQG